MPAAIVEYSTAGHDLELDRLAGPEAQVAALADDIAYNNHDIDDGLRAGLFGIADLADLPLVGPVFAEVRQALSRASRPARLIHEAIRRVIDRMVERPDRAKRERRLAAAKPASVERHPPLGRPVVAFSAAMARQRPRLEAFPVRAHVPPLSGSTA